MNNRLKNFWRGVGSVIDLAPAKDYRQFTNRRPPDERLAEHFQRVGDAPARACATYESHGHASRIYTP